MEKVVAVGRVVVGGPLIWFGAPVREHVIAVFGLIVHAVEAGHLPQRGSTRSLAVQIKQALSQHQQSYIFEENMKLFVVLWVNSGLKQRKKYVLQHLGKICDQLL